MYDYKSSNNEIKQRLEEARQRINSMGFPIIKKKAANNEEKLRNIIVGIVVILIAGELFSGKFLKIRMINGIIKNYQHYNYLIVIAV